MSNDPVTIPDFLPASFQADVDEARQQVQDAHLERHEAEMATNGDSKPRRAGARRRSPMSWVAASEVPIVTGATLIGLIGVAALTGMWAWLATTHDPIWWSFSAGGAVVFAGLAVLLGALIRRSRTLVTASQHPEPAREAVPTPA